MNKQRKEAEQLVYKVMSKLDKTGANTAHYQEKFAKMSDAEFKKFCTRLFPFRFFSEVFKVEPKITDIKDALDVLKVPLTEKVNCPHIYIDKDGNPVQSQEALVVYVPMKKLKQFITKKNSMSIDQSSRDMKTGLLTGHDKNGVVSDRETEIFAVLGLDATMQEFIGPRGDAMDSMNKMENQINTVGKVSLEDVITDKSDSLAKNLLNAYLIGSLLESNIVDDDIYDKDSRRRRVQREI